MMMHWAGARRNISIRFIMLHIIAKPATDAGLSIITNVAKGQQLANTVSLQLFLRGDSIRYYILEHLQRFELTFRK